MKTLLILACLGVSAYAECPNIEHPICSHEDMPCWGGLDPDGCSMPDTCIPHKDSNDCPGICPTFCNMGEMMCPSGEDSNGCRSPDSCYPAKGVIWNSIIFKHVFNFETFEGPMGKDGIECPAHCPVNCGMDSMMCQGGEDPNGCRMPEFCVPSKGTQLFFSQTVSKLNN